MFLLNYRETVCILQAIEKLCLFSPNCGEFQSYREAVCWNSVLSPNYRETVFSPSYREILGGLTKL